ncbi:MAG: lycopene cyclase domain-containing protein [Bacteroidota bacterium]|nr:lycopene cyclase domain-containing protein [Bacteroidota bacterium]
MHNKFTYLLIDIATILVPFVFSFYHKINFYKTWRAYWPANLLVTLIFIAWDMLYTKLGVWGFNESYICGIKIFNLPIEEVLFFICIPYASVFTYHCLKLFFNSIQLPTTLISIVLSSLLLITGIINFDKLYTAATFISMSLLLTVVGILRKQEWLKNFFLTYLLILIPFFIVNGILTGSWIDEPIVWYNDNENLGIRMLTIPFEDTFYGMLLLILNTWLYEYFLQKRS